MLELGDKIKAIRIRLSVFLPGRPEKPKFAVMKANRKILWRNMNPSKSLSGKRDFISRPVSFFSWRQQP